MGVVEGWLSGCSRNRSYDGKKTSSPFWAMFGEMGGARLALVVELLLILLSMSGWLVRGSSIPRSDSVVEEILLGKGRGRGVLAWRGDNTKYWILMGKM